MVWKFSWLRSWEEVWDPAHLAGWRAAFAEGSAAQATPYMHPDMVRAWVLSVGQANYDPFFYRAAHPDGSQAFFLMVRHKSGWRQGFARTLLPVGCKQFDYQEPVFLPGTPTAALDGGFWADLDRELRRRAGTWFDTFHLHGLRPQCLGDAPAQASEVSPFLRLSDYSDLDHYLASRKRSFRREIQRRMRRLEDKGPVSFRMHPAAELDTVLGWIPRFRAEKAKRYPSEVQITDPDGYFRNLATEGLGGVVRCSSLSLGDRSIAWEFGFCLQGVYYSYATSFDNAFHRFSPGSIHTCYLLDWAFGQNLRIFNLLGGQEAYKYDWTDGEEFRLHSLEIKSRRPASLLRRGARRGLQLLWSRGESPPASVRAGKAAGVGQYA